MEVIVRNAVDVCPPRCIHADIKIRREFKPYSHDGIKIVLTCTHSCVCKRHLDALAERGK